MRQPINKRSKRPELVGLLIDFRVPVCGEDPFQVIDRDRRETLFEEPFDQVANVCNPCVIASAGSLPIQPSDSRSP